MRALDDEAVREMLLSACQAVGGQSAWGREHGFSQSHIAHLLAGDCPPSDRLLAALGLRRVIVRDVRPVGE